MKTVAKFWGRVNRLSAVPEPSYVTLKDQTTNESYDTSAVTEKLLEKGIDHDGCEFEVVIEEDLTGKIHATLTKLEPKPVPPERVAEIKAAFDGRWDSIENIGLAPTKPESPEDRIKKLEDKILELQKLLEKRP